MGNEEVAEMVTAPTTKTTQCLASRTQINQSGALQSLPSMGVLLHLPEVSLKQPQRMIGVFCLCTASCAWVVWVSPVGFGDVIVSRCDSVTQRPAVVIILLHAVALPSEHCETAQ